MVMGNDAWKDFERWVAEEMGGERRGADFTDPTGAGKNDIIVEYFSVECKKLKTPAWGQMQKAVAQAKAAAEESDIAVAVFAKKYEDRSKSLVVMSWEEFLEVQRVVRLCYDLEDQLDSVGNPGGCPRVGARRNPVA
jgi:hypothetical protein